MKPSVYFLKKKRKTKNEKDKFFCVILETQMIKHGYVNFRKYTFKYITAYVKVPYNPEYLVHFCLPFIKSTSGSLEPNDLFHLDLKDLWYFFTKCIYFGLHVQNFHDYNFIGCQNFMKIFEIDPCQNSSYIFLLKFL